MIEVAEKSYVGLDVSKDHIDVFVLPNSQHFIISNDKTGFKKLFQKLPSPIERIVLESSSKYGWPVLKALQCKQLPACQVNPRWIKCFGQSTGMLAKNDKQDAKVCALYAQRVHPEPSLPIEKAHEQLTELERLRSKIINDAAGYKARLHVTDKSLHSTVKKVIRQLEKEAENLTSKIEKLVKNNPAWSEHIALWQGIKGVGDKVAQCLLANLPELGLVSGKAIAALAGLAPYDNESGQYKGKRKTRGGRRVVKSMLRMAVLSSIQHEPVIRSFYQQLVKRGKLKTTALTACARKLLVIINARTRDLMLSQAPATA